MGELLFKISSCFKSCGRGKAMVMFYVLEMDTFQMMGD